MNNVSFFCDNVSLICIQKYRANNYRNKTQNKTKDTVVA